MKIKGIDHIALNANDYETTLSFYRDVLGFKQLNSVCTNDFKATYLEIAEGVRLEIFDLKNKAIQIERTDFDVGVKHIAFNVENVKLHAQQIEDAGIEIVLPYSELENFKAKVVLFKDPDGNIVEFCEEL